MGIDGEPDDGATPRHDRRFPLQAAAGRADRHRRMNVRRAVDAALDAKVAVGARRPVPLVGREQLGE